MATERDIKEELLKQMDKDFCGSTVADKDSARKIIEIHKGRVKRLKWIAATGWLITLTCVVFLHNLKIYVFKQNIDDTLSENEFWFIRRSDTVSVVLVVICVLLTYLVYAKSKTLTLLQISSRLAGIEEYLRKISTDK